MIINVYHGNLDVWPYAWKQWCLLVLEYSSILINLIYDLDHMWQDLRFPTSIFGDHTTNFVVRYMENLGFTIFILVAHGS